VEDIKPRQFSGRSEKMWQSSLASWSVQLIFTGVLGCWRAGGEDGPRFKITHKTSDFALGLSVLETETEMLKSSHFL
jgi:hypothetical protein